MKNKAFHIFLILIISSAVGCASKGGVKAADEPLRITAVDFMEDKIELKANRQFTYTIYKPSDPYKVVVELPNVDAGAFGGKLDALTAGITEVTVTQVDTPVKAARMEILLETPSDVVPRYNDRTLSISIKTEEGALAASKGVGEVKEVIEVKPLPVGGNEKPVIERPAPKVMAREEVPSAPVISASGGAEESGASRLFPPAKEITQLGFDISDGVRRLIIKGDGSITPNIFALDGRIVIDMPGVAMKASLPSQVEPPVKSIRVGKYPDKVRLVLDMAAAVDFEPTAMGEYVMIALPEKKPLWEAVEQPVIAKAAPESPAEVSKEEWQKGQFTGQKISLDFQDADITPLFLLLGDVSGYNIVIHPNVKGKITLKLKNVPWDQALDIILKTFSLEKSLEGNILKIAPVSEFAKWKDDENKLKESERQAEDMMQKVIKLNYATADDVQKTIKDAKLQSPRGSITVDKRLNTLIVQDIPEGIKRVVGLVDIMDVSKPQVMIEAKIVEISSNYTRDLGIRWGGNFVASSWPIGAGTFGVNASSIALNNPASPPTGGGTDSGGFMGLTLGTANTMRVDLSLSALETANKARTLSNPKVLTLDNEMALIQQGDSIPVQTTTAEGTSTVYINANLNLKVKPRITPDGFVQIEIDANNDRAVPILGEIGIKRQGLKTNALVKDGETLVVGGIYTNTENETDTSVPALGKIPGLGWLFKTKSNTGPNTTELIILITPKIVEKTL
jgi:type IV pilus assembly protein PilQ